MNSRERLLATLNHEEPDRICADFGSTAVTGIHVRMVELLRDHYGLEKHPIKVSEPYQMLGEIDDDLQDELSIDTKPLYAPKNIFGFTNENWKNWTAPWEQELLVPADFETSKDSNIDVAFMCGTDFGTQNSQFCSVDTFESLYAPYYKRLNDWIHRNTRWKTFKHCCGAVAGFMESFIDCGFDIINPVQCSAAGMGISLFAMGMYGLLHSTGMWLLLFILLYIAAFSLSVGPVVWVILSEIFPTKIRGRAMAIATLCLWLANTVVSHLRAAVNRIRGASSIAQPRVQMSPSKVRKR